MAAKAPTYGNGKICYLEIPAEDITVSSDFYHKCFGWTLRKDNTGSASFDDTVGEVSGMWVTGRKAMSEPGIVISIMVDSVEATSKLIQDGGGKIVFHQNMSGGEVIAHFLDPFGNLMGLYQGNQ